MDEAGKIAAEKLAADSHLFWSEMGLLIVAGLVAVGLIGEFRKEASERWKRWYSAFELLVIIGVTGEVLFDGLIFAFSGQLTALQDKAVEKATIAASTATTNAGSANALAGQAIERAAKTNERAAILERENIELRKLIEVRDINDDQSSKLVKAIDGKKETVILVLPNDGEARAYAIVGLKPALQKANFVVKNEDFGSTAKNIDIIVCESGPTSTKLAQAFDTAKIPARLFKETMPERPDFCDTLGKQPGIRVYVGQRLAPIKKRR